MTFAFIRFLDRTEELLLRLAIVLKLQHKHGDLNLTLSSFEFEGTRLILPLGSFPLLSPLFSRGVYMGLASFD